VVVEQRLYLIGQEPRPYLREVAQWMVEHGSPAFRRALGYFVMGEPSGAAQQQLH
jgi:hypothetical protein